MAVGEAKGRIDTSKRSKGHAIGKGFTDGYQDYVKLLVLALMPKLGSWVMALAASSDRMEQLTPTGLYDTNGCSLG
jgi:hypothetical protein